MPKKLCRNGKLTCLVKIEEALSKCNNARKATICEFNSIQIISFGNKTIGLNGSVLINAAKININMTLTFNFTENSKYLTKSVPGTVKLVNCSLVMIDAPTPTTTAILTKTTTNNRTGTTTPRTATNTSTTAATTTSATTTNSKNTTTIPLSATPGRKAKSKSSNGKIALVILAIFILMGVGIIACYYKHRKKLSNRPAYYNDISLSDPLHTEIKFYKADGEDAEDNVEEDDDDDILPLI